MNDPEDIVKRVLEAHEDDELDISSYLKGGGHESADEVYEGPLVRIIIPLTVHTLLDHVRNDSAQWNQENFAIVTATGPLYLAYSINGKTPFVTAFQFETSKAINKSGHLVDIGEQVSYIKTAYPEEFADMQVGLVQNFQTRIANKENAGQAVKNLVLIGRHDLAVNYRRYISRATKLPFGDQIKNAILMGKNPRKPKSKFYLWMQAQRDVAWRDNGFYLLFDDWRDTVPFFERQSQDIAKRIFDYDAHDWFNGWENSNPEDSWSSISDYNLFTIQQLLTNRTVFDDGSDRFDGRPEGVITAEMASDLVEADLKDIVCDRENRSGPTEDIYDALHRAAADAYDSAMESAYMDGYQQSLLASFGADNGTWLKDEGKDRLAIFVTYEKLAEWMTAYQEDDYDPFDGQVMDLAERYVEKADPSDKDFQTDSNADYFNDQLREGLGDIGMVQPERVTDKAQPELPLQGEPAPSEVHPMHQMNVKVGDKAHKGVPEPEAVAYVTAMQPKRNDVSMWAESVVEALLGKEDEDIDPKAFFNSTEFKYVHVLKDPSFAALLDPAAPKDRNLYWNDEDGQWVDSVAQATHYTQQHVDRQQGEDSSGLYYELVSEALLGGEEEDIDPKDLLKRNEFFYVRAVQSSDYPGKVVYWNRSALEWIGSANDATRYSEQEVERIRREFGGDTSRVYFELVGKALSEDKSTFHQPENFEKVKEGSGWYLEAGAMDWEIGHAAAAVLFPGRDGHCKRIWIEISHPEGNDSGERKQADYESCKARGKKAVDTWIKIAKKLHGESDYYDWYNCFEDALKDGEMAEFVETSGVDETEWKSKAVEEAVVGLSRGEIDRILDQIRQIAAESKGSVERFIEIAEDRLEPYRIGFHLPANYPSVPGAANIDGVYLRPPTSVAPERINSYIRSISPVLHHEMIHAEQIRRSDNPEEMNASAERQIMPGGKMSHSGYRKQKQEIMAFAGTLVDGWKTSGVPREVMRERLRNGNWFTMSGHRGMAKDDPKLYNLFLKYASAYVDQLSESAEEEDIDSKSFVNRTDTGYLLVYETRNGSKWYYASRPVGDLNIKDFTAWTQNKNEACLFKSEEQAMAKMEVYELPFNDEGSYYVEIADTFNLGLKESDPKRFVRESVIEETVYKLSTTQIDLPDEIGQHIVSWGELNIPDEALFVDEDGGKGRETEQHISVLYGIEAPEPSQELIDIVTHTKPFKIQLAGVSLFENEKFDVVKVGVVSEELTNLSNAIRAACPNKNDYDYDPHVTIAYVKKGMGAELVDQDVFKEAEMPGEFWAYEVKFKGAGDSEDPKRVEEVLYFDKTGDPGHEDNPEAVEDLEPVLAESFISRAKDLIDKPSRYEFFIEPAEDSVQESANEEDDVDPKSIAVGVSDTAHNDWTLYDSKSDKNGQLKLLYRYKNGKVTFKLLNTFFGNDKAEFSPDWLEHYSIYVYDNRGDFMDGDRFDGSLEDAKRFASVFAFEAAKECSPSLLKAANPGEVSESAEEDIDPKEYATHVPFVISLKGDDGRQYYWREKTESWSFNIDAAEKFPTARDAEFCIEVNSLKLVHGDLAVMPVTSGVSESANSAFSGNYTIRIGAGPSARYFGFEEGQPRWHSDYEKAAVLPYAEALERRDAISVNEVSVRLEPVNESEEEDIDAKDYTSADWVVQLNSPQQYGGVQWLWTNSKYANDKDVFLHGGFTSDLGLADKFMSQQEAHDMATRLDAFNKRGEKNIEIRLIGESEEEDIDVKDYASDWAIKINDTEWFWTAGFGGKQHNGLTPDLRLATKFLSRQDAIDAAAKLDSSNGDKIEVKRVNESESGPFDSDGLPGEVSTFLRKVRSKRKSKPANLVI